MNQYEQKIYSQFGEDGITIELINRIYGDDHRYKRYVEFGVADGRECNARVLKDRYGWSGLMMDMDYHNPSMNLMRERINRENVLQIFEKYQVPLKFELLSVDIDGNDFYVINEIFKKYTVDIIVCEYNGSHLKNVDAVVEYDPSFFHDGSNYYGASLLAMRKLMNLHGYSLVAATSQGVNAFFVNDKVLAAKNNLGIENVNDIGSIYRKPTYGREGGVNGGHDKDPLNRPFITSYQSLNLNPDYEHYLKLLNAELDIDYTEIKTIIETGSHRGNGSITFASVFENVYSIELSRDLYDYCCKTHKVPNLKFIHGASTDMMSNVINEITGEYMVFLDAHSSGGDTTFDPRVGKHGAPVLEELDALKPNPPKVVVIDDLRCFDDPALHYPSRDQIINKMSELGNYSEPKVVYYNEKPQWFCFRRLT